MANQQLKIGIFGFGCVGQGLYDVLQKTEGTRAEILKICVKDREKSRPLSRHYFTFDPDEILNHPEINVVLELIDDAEAAFEIVSRALKAGKAVVSANKKLVAERFDELLHLQKETGSPFLYEAACCASIPIIRNLEEYYDNDLLGSIEGIFNGSSNYILSQLSGKGRPYLEALSDAQEKGFAETDPTLDVGGYDSRYKLSILVTHAFGLRLPPETIFNFGISAVCGFDLKFAGEKNARLKLLARARKFGNDLYAAVLPQFVAEDSPLYGIENEYNSVVLEGAFSEKQVFTGKGAGGYPTGSAVLSDLSALRYSYRYEYRKIAQNPPRNQATDFCLKVYFRYQDQETLTYLRFEEIEESYRGPEWKYIIGKIRLSELQDFSLRFPNGNYFFAETPDSSPEPLPALEKVLVPV